MDSIKRLVGEVCCMQCRGSEESVQLCFAAPLPCIAKGLATAVRGVSSDRALQCYAYMSDQARLRNVVNVHDMRAGSVAHERATVGPTC